MAKAAGGKGGGSGGGAGEAGGGFAGMIQGVSAVFNQLRGEINGLLNTVAKFVGALNPGLLSAFNAVMQNLNATVGFGLEPILAQATETFRAFAGQILPLMMELRPVLADLSQALSGLFTAIVSSVITQLRVYLAILAPLVKFTAGLAGIVSTLIDVYGVLLETIVQFIQEFLASIGFGDAVSDVLNVLVEAIKKAVIGLSFLAASLLRLVGLTDFLAKFRENLAKRLADRKAPPGGMVAAPKDVGTSGIEDIAKRMSERAFAATGGAAAKKNDTELLEGILEAVSMAETLDWEALITRAVEKAFTAAFKMLPGRETVAALKPVASSVTDVSATSVDRAAAAYRAGGGTTGAFLAVAGGAASDVGSGISWGLGKLGIK